MRVTWQTDRRCTAASTCDAELAGLKLSAPRVLVLRGDNLQEVLEGACAVVADLLVPIQRVHLQAGMQSTLCYSLSPGITPIYRCSHVPALSIAVRRADAGMGDTNASALQSMSKART